MRCHDIFFYVKKISFNLSCYRHYCHFKKLTNSRRSCNRLRRDTHTPINRCRVEATDWQLRENVEVVRVGRGSGGVTRLDHDYLSAQNKNNIKERGRGHWERPAVDELRLKMIMMMMMVIITT